MEEKHVTIRHICFICAIIALTVILSVTSAAFSICMKIDTLKKEINQIDTTITYQTQVPRPILYHIKEYNGKIAVITSNGEICEILEVWVDQLPKKDRDLLAVGFNVYSLSEFASVIEDYTG